MINVEDKSRLSPQIRYKICFACTLPGEPGCGCPDNDFYAEHGFLGTPEEAIEEAEIISWQEYCGDFQWWIIEDPNAKVYIKKKVDSKDNQQQFIPTRMSDELKKSPLITHHESREELEAILDDPSWLSIKAPLPAEIGDRGFHDIQFDVYNNDVLVDRGNRKPGMSPGKKYGKGAEESLVTVREMLYDWNLSCGREATHILRVERDTSFHTDELVKKYPLKFDIYTFSADPELLRRAEEKRRAQLEERKRRFDALSERLRMNGTTLSKFFSSFSRSP